MKTEKKLERIRAARIRAENGAWARASAYVITHPDKYGRAIIRVAHPTNGAGRLNVFVWGFDEDNGGSTQHGSATGGGYDKLSCALAGLTIGGITLKDHCAGGNWEIQLRDAGYNIIRAL